MTSQTVRSRHVVITCGVLQKELLAWPERDRFDLDFIFLPSSLDLDFDRLEKHLVRKLNRVRDDYKDGDRFVLYGQCHPLIQDFVRREGGVFLELGNCFELLIGKEAYQRELAKGAYFLLPQWAGYWKKIFTKKLGLDEKIGPIFFQEMQSYAVYLDTGFDYAPKFQPAEFTEFTGLNLRRQDVDCTRMYTRLTDTFAK